MTLYGGPLELMIDGEKHVDVGQLELKLVPKASFAAHIAGSSADLQFASLTCSEPKVAVPPGSALDPPTGPVLLDGVEGIRWPLNHLEAGDARAADRFLIHVSGPFEAQLPVRQVHDGRQPCLPFDLSGWKLVLAAVERPVDDEDFQFVIEAVPVDPPADSDTVARLRDRLFILLSLLAGAEVGVGPVCGMSAEGRVVWAHWVAPRLRHGRPAVRWCPEPLVANNLPILCRGFDGIAADPALASVVDRAINHLLVAGGREVLDVRIPVSCSGLELLGWAILQRHGWLGVEPMSKLPASAITRLLIQWAGIPITIPDGFDALARRTRRLGQQDWAGPEVLFNVRNALVHPPKRLEEPEWPSSEELTQS